MGPAVLWCLSFCLLACLASGSPVEEHPANETQVAIHEDHDDHVLSLIHHFRAFVQSRMQASARDGKQCPPKWTRHGFFCYRFINYLQTYGEAEEQCQSYGGNGHLVSIHREREELFLMETIVPHGEEGSIWTGGSNINNCQVWYWSDHTPMNYQSWGKEPPTECNGVEACIAMTSETGFKTWVEEPCSNAHKSVCKNDL